MNKPNKLESLDLDDYSGYISRTKEKENMIYILNFIKAELTNPFLDPRKKKT